MKPKCTMQLFVVLPVLLAAVTFTACRKEAQAPATTVATVVVDSVASEDGLMIYYDVRETGDKTLLFIHGWCCDRSYWDAQVEEFAKSYRVVTIDLGGHGQSGLERETWTMPAFGADVAAVVEKLDLSNVIMVGHSMGGMVVIEAARRLPGRVVALVGVDTFQDFSRSLTQEQINGFLAAFQADFAGTTDQFVRGMFSEGSDSALVEQIATDMAAAPPEVGLSAIGEFLGHDYRSALAEVRLPIRTINCDMYPTDVEGNRAIAESFEVRLMPGTGHFLHMEDPVTFNRLLSETLFEFWPAADE